MWRHGRLSGRGVGKRADEAPALVPIAAPGRAVPGTGWLGIVNYDTTPPAASNAAQISSAFPLALANAAGWA